jgi:hypothetical protein
MPSGEYVSVINFVKSLLNTATQVNEFRTETDATNYVDSLISE